MRGMAKECGEFRPVVKEVYGWRAGSGGAGTHDARRIILSGSFAGRGIRYVATCRWVAPGMRRLLRSANGGWVGIKAGAVSPGT